MLSLNELKRKQIEAHEEFLKQELGNPATADKARTKLAELYDVLFLLGIIDNKEVTAKFDELYK